MRKIVSYLIELTGHPIRSHGLEIDPSVDALMWAFVLSLNLLNPIKDGSSDPTTPRKPLF